MKINRVCNLKGLIAVIAFAVTNAASAHPDLTGSDAKTLKRHLGKIVSLRGNLSSELMQGTCLVEVSLSGALPERVEFFITPDKVYHRDSSPWVKMQGRKVRVTGKLHFYPVWREPAVMIQGLGGMSQKDYYHMIFGSPLQRPPGVVQGLDREPQKGYYYMVMGKTKLEVEEHGETR